jgi:hypothetical protein
MTKYYFIKVKDNLSVWTPDISQDHIDSIEQRYGCKVISIEEDGLDHSVKVSPEKCDDNTRCMSDSNGSRMFQGGQNKFGY